MQELLSDQGENAQSTIAHMVSSLILGYSERSISSSRTALSSLTQSAMDLA